VILALATKYSSGFLEVNFTNEAIRLIEFFIFGFKIDHFESNQKSFIHEHLESYWKHTFVNNRTSLKLPPSLSDILDLTGFPERLTDKTLCSQMCTGEKASAKTCQVW